LFEATNIEEIEGEDKSGNKLRKGQKNGRLLTSHRYNRLPLLPSGPEGVQQELVV